MQMSEKTIHFIRHAQSRHNARVLEVPDEDIARRDPALLDAPLTDLGHQQAAALAAEIAQLTEIELVVTSPLTRAIQTMLAAFAHHPAPRIVEHRHREHQDSYCDIGRAPALLAADFPMLQFEHLSDPWWKISMEQGDTYPRETAEELQRRVEVFSDWLRQRPEKTIAVVGHGTFLRALTGKPFANAERYVCKF
ncbi:MAG: histidine phosphatase family protein [Ahrensia sp.]|nr:histidine phosphatase family protein [Ahrensia sp.]